MFANNLSSANIGSGRRNEIVFSEGLSFGSTSLLPLSQSTYSVESAVAQNANSSSSDLNFGILNFGHCYLFDI